MHVNKSVHAKYASNTKRKERAVLFVHTMICTTKNKKMIEKMNDNLRQNKHEHKKKILKVLNDSTVLIKLIKIVLNLNSEDRPSVVQFTFETKL